jgi:hypothetical protein
VLDKERGLAFEYMEDVKKNLLSVSGGKEIFPFNFAITKDPFL